jgi:hypothetical protein
MSKAGIEKSIKLYGWWASVSGVQWSRSYGGTYNEAQTFAQASLNSTRLGLVSAFGIFWSLAGAAWLAKLKKTRTT